MRRRLRPGQLPTDEISHESSKGKSGFLCFFAASLTRFGGSTSLTVTLWAGQGRTGGGKTNEMDPSSLKLIAL